MPVVLFADFTMLNMGGIGVFVGVAVLVNVGVAVLVGEFVYVLVGDGQKLCSTTVDTWSGNEGYASVALFAQFMHRDGLCQDWRMNDRS